MPLLLMLIFALTCTPNLFAQQTTRQTYSAEEQKIFDELRMQDSILFEEGFNHCDTSQLQLLISDDFEFYHDLQGLVESKEQFVNGIPNLCQMNYKPTRQLVKNSLEIFPLYAKGKIYGAIQKGEHEFWGKEDGKAKYLTSTAKFTHVWIIEQGTWRLKRVLSYDHVSPQ